MISKCKNELHDKEVSRDEKINTLEIWIENREGAQKGKEIFFLCPFHNDHNPSCRWNPEKEVWYCDPCGKGGGWRELYEKLEKEILSAENKCTPARAYENNNTSSKLESACCFPAECSLDSYVSEKQISKAVLETFGLSDFEYQGKPSIKVPYYGESGEELSVRYRINLHGKNRFLWKKGSKPYPYGLWKLNEVKKQNYVILVEGESDCHTLWKFDFPALGIPGAANWKKEWEKFFEGIETVYVVIEPDKGGETVFKSLKESSLRNRIKLIEFPTAKDTSEFYLSDPLNFESKFKNSIDHAVPLSVKIRTEKEALRSKSFEICKDIASNPNILDCFESDLLKLGFAGETKAAKIIFLALISRVFYRPISIAVKGPSSGGKSFLVETVLAFFPPSSFYALSAMSERTLIYSEEPLSHRFLVLYEATGLGTDFSSYLIRSLLSEGHVRYETVEKTPKGFKPRLIDKLGPTGLITTTTGISLHPENETRIISLPVSDTPEQTSKVLLALAEKEEGNLSGREPEFKQWHALQDWINSSEKKVVIPFAKKLAEFIPPVAIRLRRDFHHILTLIKCHSLLHQANRKEDSNGNICATYEDYGAVKDLVSEFISESAQSSVSEPTRKTVEAVEDLYSEGIGISIKQLADRLELDPSTARRRAHVAIQVGYIKNDAPKGKPMVLSLGDPMPAAQELLPDINKLSLGVQPCTKNKEACLISSRSDGVCSPSEEVEDYFEKKKQEYGG